MSLKNLLKKKSENDFETLWQDRYSDRLDVRGLVDKRTGQKFIGLIFKEKDPKKRKDFFENRKRSEDIRSFVAKDYQGETFLPEIFKGRDEVILTPYAGQSFTDNLYNSLSSEEQRKAEKDLATFLNHMHQKAYATDPFLHNVNCFDKLKEHMTPLSANLDKNLDEILEIWKNVADTRTLAQLRKLVNEFKGRDKSDEKSVLIHNDMCDDNVLYDQQSKKLAVIDFEYARIGNVYDDFCHFGGIGFPRKFITGVIKEYNKLTKQSKHSCPISMKKLEMFWKIAILNNQACWVKDWGRTPEEAYKILIQNSTKLNPQRQKNEGR